MYMLEFLTIQEVKSNIGIWCKALRKERGISQAELARELSLSTLTISKLEKGKNPTLDTLLKVMKYFQEMDSLNRWIVEKIQDLESKPSLY